MPSLALVWYPRSPDDQRRCNPLPRDVGCPASTGVNALALCPLSVIFGV